MITAWGRYTSANVQKVIWTIGEHKPPYQRFDIGGSFDMDNGYKF